VGFSREERTGKDSSTPKVGWKETVGSTTTENWKAMAQSTTKGARKFLEIVVM
jgi:hypothetical protein